MRPSVWFFKGLGLDERLGDEVRERMKELGRMERWGHSGEVHGAGDEDMIAVVLKGGVWADDGTQARRVLLKPGDALGGLAGSREGALFAHDETELLTLPRARFDEAIAPHVGAREGLFIEVPTAPLLYTTPTSRVARALTHWVDGLDPGAEYVTPRVPLRALGRFVGLDRERARAALAVLGSDGAIERKRTRLRVKDLEALKRHARGS
jgi:hypothetical protein